MLEFLDILEKRKSVRSFLDKSVPRDLIEKILTAATYAPTCCNQQRWNFVVVDDANVKERLVKEATSNTLFRRAPTIVFVAYDSWNYKEAIQGASLAVGHIILAAEYYGLSALPMNSFGGQRKVKKLLGIPSSEIICCCVVLGYPDERARNAPIIPRRPLAEVLHWNTFENRSRPAYTYDPNQWSLEGLKEHHKYYCRKTTMGKEMDLASTWERELVRTVLSDVRGSVLDLFSYDGSYIQLLPDSAEVNTVDLTPETAAYSRATGELSHRPVAESVVFKPNRIRVFEKPIRYAVLIYKAERLPDSVLTDILKQTYQTLEPGGEFVVIARKQHLFYWLFFFGIRFIFGTDIRKTGIYAFFGPYKPICVNALLQKAKETGFERIEWSGYFAFPAFVEQIYQMMAQYIKSEGSSYLHRERRDDIVSRAISKLLVVQGMKKVGRLGSVAVLVCKKK